ncbi:MAG: PQ-loop domain-containing transporter [archaeon]
MPTMRSGFHHYHKRIKLQKKLQSISSSNSKTRFVDKLIYFAAVFGPIITIPQLLEIFLTQSAQGVSIISWSGFLLVSFIWLAYGFLHKYKPVIFANVLYAVFQLGIIIGIFLYG